VRVNHLVEADENRRKAFIHLVQSQDKVKGTFDKKVHPRVFVERDLVLMWDKKKENLGHGKFEQVMAWAL
jgi:hypothetical protein